MKSVAMFRTSSDAGLTPGGIVSAETLLAYLNEKIIFCNDQIETAEKNGTEVPWFHGARKTLKTLKEELYGKTYNT